MLARLPKAAGPGWQAQAVRSLTVRRLAAPVSLPVQAAAVPLASAARPPVRGSVETRQAAPAASGESPAPAPLAAPAAAGTAAAMPPLLETGLPGGVVPPVYATRLPPAVTLRYALQRGSAQGQAELRWQPGEDRYALHLRTQLTGAPAVVWASEGGLDADGIAPERYAESRRGREQRAANFQRPVDAPGRITFSGPQVEYPLLGGAQDRLSWLVQLAGVMAADPALASPGREVAIFVAGTRGDGDVWIFTVVGAEDIDLPAGPVTGALHLRREPRRPYDTLAEAWLDPARHHLPVRVRLRVRPTGEGSEWQLQELQPSH